MTTRLSPARTKRIVLACALLALGGPARYTTLASAGPVVNDVHSRLNRTVVHRVVKPHSVADIQRAIRLARAEGRAISIAGARHAMGGQQFGADTVLLDMSRMTRVIHFDPDQGTVEVEAGIDWPTLMAYLAKAQEQQREAWGIRQKQTGADRFSIGGSLAANIHGRGLGFKPIVDDVESILLVDSQGALRTCSRSTNRELFRLVVGGYGLFGVIAHVKLRLMPRQKLERLVELAEVDEVVAFLEQRRREGFLYGDFQFSTDPASTNYLRLGVVSCYRPVDASTAIPRTQKALSVQDWKELYYLSHTDPAGAFKKYTRHYLATSGQIYWSDTHQLSPYFPGYHVELDRKSNASVPGTEMITELYVPREDVGAFMNQVRRDFRRHNAQVVYGTVRLIERDQESFLAWAKQNYACVVFNLHVDHDPDGLSRARRDFRLLIDRALAFGGSFYLTYHRWATRRQVEACYPEFPEFLDRKLHYDPLELFQSDWYRHYKTLFANSPTRVTNAGAELAPRAPPQAQRRMTRYRPPGRANALPHDLFGHPEIGVVGLSPKTGEHNLFHRLVPFEEALGLAQGDPRSPLQRKTVDACTDGGEGHALEVSFLDKGKTAPVTTRQQLILALGAAMPNRPNGVNHPLCEKVVALGDLRVAGLAPSQRLTFLEQFRPRRPMYSPVHAAATSQRSVRCVDNGIDLQPRDIAFDNLDALFLAHTPRCSPALRGVGLRHQLLEAGIAAQRSEVLVITHPLEIPVSQRDGPLQRLERPVRPSGQRVAAAQVIPDFRFFRAQPRQLEVDPEPLPDFACTGVQIAQRLQHPHVLRASVSDRFEKSEFDPCVFG